MPRLFSRPLAGAVAVLFCGATTVFAADIDSDFEEEKPWKEAEVTLPAFPEEANLIAFQVGAVRDMRYFVDGPSISIGADDVVRLTLVVVSSEGARNIGYEGLRCATGERRFYASGRSDKTWSRARSDRWVRVMGDSNNPYVELMNNNICGNGGLSVFTPEAIRRTLRQGGFKR